MRQGSLFYFFQKRLKKIQQLQKACPTGQQPGHTSDLWSSPLPSLYHLWILRLWRRKGNDAEQKRWQEAPAHPWQCGQSASLGSWLVSTVIRSCCVLLSGGGRGAQKATSADSAVGHGLHSPLVLTVFKWGLQPMVLRASTWLHNLEWASQAWRPHYVIRSLENELFFSLCNQRAWCSPGAPRGCWGYVSVAHCCCCCCCCSFQGVSASMTRKEGFLFLYLPVGNSIEVMEGLEKWL